MTAARTAVGVWMVTLVVAGQSARSLPPEAARQAILAAEDGRTDIPDGLHTPSLDVLRARLAEDVRVLVELTRSTDSETQRLALRALGRYERRELTNEILQFLGEGPLGEVAFSLAQSMRGEPLPADTAGEQLRGVQEALLLAGERDGKRERAALADIVRAIGRLPYVWPAQVQDADGFLARTFARVEPDPDLRDRLPDVAAAAESLARLHSRLSPLGRDTLTWLARIVASRRRTYAPEARQEAMRALVAARSVDADTLRIAASADPPELRRLAAISLAGAAADIPLSERTGMLIELLEDRSAAVRFEAVRAWTRQQAAVEGCVRLFDRLKDTDIHVVTLTIDLLGDACRGDVTVTDRLAADARTPPASNWHRETHALVALARRAPDRAAAPLLAAIAHPTWQVRMYAARAASLMDDRTALERLAVDAEDNVVEATLAALRRIKKEEAEPHFVAALRRRDYQLLRTAANEMKGMRPGPELAGALADALKRVTEESRETSRDTRLALIARLEELGDENQAAALVPLLRDFDIRVALAASQTLERWTGKPQALDPQPQPRQGVPTARELSDAAQVTLQIRLAGRANIEMTLLPQEAPLTSVRFLRLVRLGYYDGLTFHRVVPGFVVQGGSPGANEYAGHDPYARDERSRVSHARGTVGLSTRGRDTGDMQFFVNLQDNPRLDYEYTVFGRIRADDMDVIDTITEGARISQIVVKKDDDRQK